MTGTQASLSAFQPDTPQAIVERVQATAADAVAAQGVSLDV
jgi:hypothetical protein